ncbi:MAG: DUF1566 domain-containing protein [Desulfobacteraceae bacterium]|jgi:serine/threonine-protein kinase|nr:MAG: DUF1566 domain-containing protein [Desulfobacteraceae bacterium]
MKKIGAYEICGLLGKGGMGRVYKVRAPFIGRILALKRLEPHRHLLGIMGEEALKDVFTLEARTLAEIRHPHIAAILDFDHDAPGRPFFVMEYCCMNLGILTGEHGELERPSRILPPRRAVRYVRQALDGLQRLHYDGIIHRDIKPDNLLLTENDSIKIVDFGLSRITGTVMKFPDRLKIGTPYYAPPEQENDPDAVDPRSDLFGLGMLCWRLLTGVIPVEQWANRHPGDINPVLGHAWDKFLATSVQIDPGQRFQDAEAMRIAAESAFDDWLTDMEASCRLNFSIEKSEEKSESGHESQAIGHPGIFAAASPRRQPIKIDANRARKVFNLDENWRPVNTDRGPADQPAFGDRFRIKPGMSQIVYDDLYGRVWEQSGSPYPVSRKEADDYIDGLNRARFAGYRNWRLPTIDELLNLIRPSDKPNDFCQPEMFAPRQNRIWSADRKSYISAWFVDTETGFAAAGDMACAFYVRAIADREAHQA